MHQRKKIWATALWKMGTWSLFLVMGKFCWFLVTASCGAVRHRLFETVVEDVDSKNICGRARFCWCF